MKKHLRIFYSIITITAVLSLPVIARAETTNPFLQLQQGLQALQQNLEAQAQAGQAQLLAAVKQFANGVITAIVNAANEQKALITNNTDLSTNDKNRLTTEYDKMISASNKASADITKAANTNEIDIIWKNLGATYRAEDLAIKKISVEIYNNKIDATLTTYTNVANQTQQVLKTLHDTYGYNTTEAEQLLVQYRTKLNDAASHAHTAVELYSKTVTLEDLRASMPRITSELQTANTDLHQAGDLYQQLINSVKK